MSLRLTGSVFSNSLHARFDEKPFLLITCGGLDVELYAMVPAQCIGNASFRAAFLAPSWNTETRTSMNFGAAMKMAVKGCFKERP